MSKTETQSEALTVSKCTAADGKTQIYSFSGTPLMVRAVDFNAMFGRLDAENKALRARLDAADETEIEYQRGFRHGYNQRDAEVQGALV